MRKAAEASPTAPRSTVLPFVVIAGLAISGFVASFAEARFPAVALVVFIISITAWVWHWASSRGDILVTALALVLFWLPFNVTATRFGISPQEIAVYGIFIIGAFLAPQGTRAWLGEILQSFSAGAKLALFIFALLCVEAVIVALKTSDPITLLLDLRMTLIYPALLALLLAYAVRTRQSLATFTQAFVGGATLLAIYGLVLFRWGVDIANGSVAGRLGAETSPLTSYHPNNLGLYFVFALCFIPVIVIEALKARRYGMVGAASGAAIILLVALWLTYSRGALLSLIIAFLVIAAIVVLFGSRRSRLLIIGSACLVGAVSTLILLFKGTSILGRYADLLLGTNAVASDPNVQFRVQLTSRAVSEIEQHPFTGLGFNSFTQGAAVPFSPHNTYVDLWLSLGFFGVLAFVVLLGSAMWSLFRITRELRRKEHAPFDASILGFLGLSAAFIAQGFVETYSSEPRITPAIWLTIGFAQGIYAAFFADAKRADAVQQIDVTYMRTRRLAPIMDGDTLRLPARLDDLNAVNAASDITFGAYLPDIWHEDAITDQPTRRISPISAPLLPPPDTTPSAQPTEKVPASHVMRAEKLLQRAPASYAWNQIYTLWFFVTNFVFSIVLTHGLTRDDYGLYAVLMTVVNTLLFIFAFGLEDGSTVYLPRLLSQQGQGATGALMRRLLLQRFLVIAAIGGVIAIGLPLVLPYLNQVGISPLQFAPTMPQGRLRAILIGAYIIGSSLTSLESTFFGSLLRSRTTFIIGGGTQLFNVVLCVLFLRAGYSIDGILLTLALVSMITAILYLLVIIPMLFGRFKRPFTDAKNMRHLMFSAWLTNVTNGALGKQMDIIIMVAFAVSYVQIGYYNLSYQLTNIVGLLLISGLGGGVGMAALSAALSAGGTKRLGEVWRMTLMLQILLTVPLLGLCLVRADTIVPLLYGQQYINVVPLFRIFILFTIAGRLIGGGNNQSVLYVLGLQRRVVIVRWLGFLINLVLDVTLIPRFGPIGALTGTGFSQVAVGFIEYLMVRGRMQTRYPAMFAWKTCSAVLIGALVIIEWSPQGLGGLIVASLIFTIVFVSALAVSYADSQEELQRIIASNQRLSALITMLSLRRHKSRAIGAQG
jgi:O-antigen/teichoic acid export membrane protein/O-antigen ligase